MQRAQLSAAEFEGPRYQRIAHVLSLRREGVLDETLRVRPGAAAGNVRPGRWLAGAGDRA